jgi:transcriptional regulator with XRE-family HTH domain
MALPPPPDLKAFGARLRTLRLAAGLTQAQLADRTGYAPSYIGTLEQGRRQPRLGTLYQLATALGVRPGELLE